MSQFSNDIFISYAHNDNRGSNWVTAFVRQLGFAVTQRLGRAPRIFFDSNGRMGGNETEEVFEREARQAAIFLPIVSPSFVRDDAWTQKELTAFLTQKDTEDRIFPVELLPVEAGAMPPGLQRIIRKHKFWFTSPETGSDVEIQLDPVTDARSFTLRIQDLAAKLSRQLADLSQGPAPRRPDPPDPAERPVTLLLGQVTFDLEEDHSRLRSYLEQFGYRVLPDDMLPQGGADFREAFGHAVTQSDLFVQLLGPHPDRRPKDLPEGYTAHQHAAAQSAGLPRLLWCRPDLPPDQRAAHRDADLFAQADLMACGSEEFKAAVLARLRAIEAARARPAPARDPQGGEQVFIDSDRVDLDLARNLAGQLQAQAMNVVLPIFDGAPEDISRDFRESVSDCSGIVVVFGAAQAAWVRARLRLISRLGYELPAASRKVIAVYLHPPRGQDDVGVLSQGIVWIDGQNPAREQALTRALRAAAP